MIEGSPKTLQAAIQNGINEYNNTWDTSKTTRAEVIESHVVDYLAQGFSHLMFHKDPAVVQFAKDYWFNLTGRKI